MHLICFINLISHFSSLCTKLPGYAGVVVLNNNSTKWILFWWRDSRADGHFQQNKTNHKTLGFGTGASCVRRNGILCDFVCLRRLWSHVHICHEQNTRVNALWISMWKVLRDLLTICRYISQFDFLLGTSVVLVPYEMNKTQPNSYVSAFCSLFPIVFIKINDWMNSVGELWSVVESLLNAYPKHRWWLAQRLTYALASFSI